MGFFDNKRYMQYISAFSACLARTSVATFLTWPSPTLPKLTSPESPIGVQISQEEASWVVSILLLSSLPGSFVNAWLVDKIGRKGMLLLSTITLFVPWIIIYFASSLTMLYVGRAMGGIGFACVAAGCSIYTGEIADKDIRGRLSTSYNMMRLVGTFIVLSIGPFVSFKALAALCGCIPLGAFILFCFMPESPYYLVKNGRYEEAKHSLVRLSKNIEPIENIEKKIKEIEFVITHDSQNKSSLMDILTKKEYRRCMTIMAGLKTLQLWCGLIAIEAYMQTIIKSANSSLSPELSSILFGLIQFPAVAATAYLVDKIGRRPLLITSCSFCGVALMAEGFYFYLQDHLKADVSNWSWLPATGVLVYIVMNPVGLNTIPYIVQGEIFPTNIKAVGSSICTFYSGVNAFIVSKSFQPLCNYLGMYGTFWVFAGFCVFGIFFAIFILPETKGKSFVEIQESLADEKKEKNNMIQLQ